MSDIVERAKAALEGVTEEPWVYVPEVPAWSGRWQVGTQKSGMSVARDLFSTDARFIAAARSLLPELVAEVERLRGCPHDSWSGDGTGRWRCDECGADQGSQDVGEVRRQLAESQADVERLRHELSDAAARIRAFAKDNVHHGDMTPMAQRQWNVLADTIASARSGVGVQEEHQ